MTNLDVYIESYFSVPTDLAGEMTSWPEFVSGNGYNVDLRSDNNSVTVRLESSGETKFVRVCGNCGSLFDRVVGLCVQALLASSDNVVVSRNR
jgi:hypothetical protein